MDFKDILTQLDSLKGDEKKPVKKESKKTRPSNMLTESTDIVEPVTKEFKLPSLKNVFEELSIQPAAPGAQEIQKDGQTIGTVSQGSAGTIKQAIDKGELTIGEEEIAEAEDWIDKAVKKPGAFKAQAERAGKSTAAFAKHVLANKDKFNAKTEKRANLAKTFSKMKETDTPPESSMDLTSPISGGGMRESDGSGSYGGQSPLSYDTQRSSKMKVKEEIKLQQITPKMGDNGSNTQSVIAGKKVKEGANMAAQYGPDDGSHNSSNDEKGNAAANAALAANDSDTPQLVTEKDYDVKPTRNPKPAKGKVLNPKGKTNGQASPETYVESKSRKLPSISRLKSMCNEGLSTSAIQQLHPKCNKKELNIMIKNTKTNLKEGADHILKAAKHMGHAHGLCKGSYACPHDEGSEGHNSYHEGYKSGLDEACGMPHRQDETFGAPKGMGDRQAPIVGLTNSMSETEDSIVDTMASYGAMGEAESSPDGNVGADDDGAYDKYDWDAQTVARKGIDEDEFEEGNAFSGALASTHKGGKFSVGGKEFTKTTEDAYLEEDEWTFESLDSQLDSVLKEGQVEEGYTMSITQGEENTPDRVSVNATDAEADKLIKFVKDVGLGQYGDEEVAVDAIDPAEVSFYGSDAPEASELGSHDDMLKLMGIVDFEDEVEAPGTMSDVDVQVDGESEEMCEACGSKMTNEGCGCSETNEGQGYNDREDEQLGMKDGKESSKKQSMHDRRDDSRGDFGHRHGGQLEEKQGYDDEEDESLGMRTGKESGKHQSMKDRRDDSYGKFGKRDSEHREISKEDASDSGFDQDDEKHDNYGMDDESHGRNHGALGGRGDKGRGDDSEKPMKFDEESDVERDDHAEKAGREVAHDAKYDDRRHSGKDGKDVTRDIEYDEMHEDQGYDDKEDESLGMRTGKESDKHQSDKDRRDDSYGKYGSRDEEHNHLKEMMAMLSEVGAESSEEPTQPLSQHDDERLLTKEGAEDAPKDDVNDGENEEITETQTEDQREFAVAEDEDIDEGKIPAGLKAYQDKKKGKKDDDKDVKEEKLDEWANDAGKIGTETTFEQDIDFMTKVISGGLNKQKSTGQTTVPVIAGQNDRMGYNSSDSINEGSVMSHDGLAGLMHKIDELSK